MSLENSSLFDTDNLWSVSHICSRTFTDTNNLGWSHSVHKACGRSKP